MTYDTISVIFIILTEEERKDKSHKWNRMEISTEQLGKDEIDSNFFDSFVTDDKGQISRVKVRYITALEIYQSVNCRNPYRYKLDGKS